MNWKQIFPNFQVCSTLFLKGMLNSSTWAGKTVLHMANFCLHKQFRGKFATVWKECWISSCPEWVYFSLPALFPGDLMFNNVIFKVISHDTHPFSQPIQKCVPYRLLPAAHPFCNVFKTSHLPRPNCILDLSLPGPTNLFLLLFSFMDGSWTPRWIWQKPGSHSLSFCFSSSYLSHAIHCSVLLIQPQIRIQNPQAAHHLRATILALAAISHQQVNSNRLLARTLCFHTSPLQIHQLLRYF